MIKQYIVQRIKYLNQQTYNTLKYDENFSGWNTINLLNSEYAHKDNWVKGCHCSIAEKLEQKERKQRKWKNYKIIIEE